MGANEFPISSQAIYSARPTIEIDGQPLERVALGLGALTVTESVDGLAALELRLSNWVSTPQGDAEFAFDAGSALALGSAVRVLAGVAGEQEVIFAGRVSCLEAGAGERLPPLLVVRAEDRLMAARLARRSHVYTDLSLGDLAQQIGQNLGLTVEARELPNVNATFAQFNESDLAFLRRVLARYDCSLRIVGESLRVASRVDRGEMIELALYSQLRQVHIVADLAHQATRVTVSGWDAMQGAAFNEEATGTQLGAGQGRSGAELLQQHFGERSEHLAAFACRDANEARALAQAAFDQRARRFLTIRGTVEGNNRLRAGSLVTLSGLGARFDNSYEVAEVKHRFDLAEGYQTEFIAHGAYLAAN